MWRDMDKITEILLNSPKCLEQVQKVGKNMSHTVMIVHENTDYANAFAKLLIAYNECENGHLCKECSNCLKVLHDTCVDVFNYPQKNSLTTDEVEDIIDSLNLVPVDLKKKYYVIKNIESSSLPAQNKLLKNLEEPPKNAMFILLCSNLRQMLPTISSRAEKIVLESYLDVDYTKIFPDTDSKVINFAKTMSGGDFGVFLKYVNNENYFNLYNLSKRVVDNMNTTLDMLEYSSYILKVKDNILEFFEMFIVYLRDCLAIKCQSKYSVINDWDLKDITNSSEKFSRLALIKIIQECSLIKEKLKFNANVNGVVDKFLLCYLEVKNICKQ